MGVSQFYSTGSITHNDRKVPHRSVYTYQVAIYHSMSGEGIVPNKIHILCDILPHYSRQAELLKPDSLLEAGTDFS